MWIIMTKTYAGAEGIFLRGIKFDLSEAKCERLRVEGEKCWEKTCPPWEEHTDHKAVKAAEGRRAYGLAKAKAKLLAGAAKAIHKAADEARKAADEARTAAKAAKERAVLAQSKAEKKNATNEHKQKAIALNREHAGGRIYLEKNGGRRCRPKSRPTRKRTRKRTRSQTRRPGGKWRAPRTASSARRPTWSIERSRG